MTKYTLNLFPSDFELPATHQDKTPFLAHWAAPDVVRQLHQDPAGKPLFLLHDGPPYANGSLHLGHLVNKTLKDALLKFKRLDGWFAPFVPGFDCHGLPVELEVEKQGHSKEDPRAFVEACRAYAQSQVDLQTRGFQTFGVSADWAAGYKTMDPEFEAQAARLFHALPGREQRLRPVHWCSQCRSSLAEAEVEYRAKKSPSVNVLFPWVSAPGAPAHPHRYLQVWTTTPYTLPGNRAVGYHPALTYVEVPAPTEDEPLRTLVRLRRQGEEALPSVDLAKARVRSPWSQATVPLLNASFVSASATGLVHLAPAFGMEDYQVCEQHRAAGVPGLALQAWVGDDGRMLSELPEHAHALQGLSLTAASDVVLDGLAERGLLLTREQAEHEYPHCWRHKTPVYFRASSEWFLDLTTTGKQARAALADVTFVPAAGRARLDNMLENRQAWCVSRQRLWGTPLVEDAAELDLLERVQAQGLSAWHEPGRSPRRTLDVWFDSGVSHELVLRKQFGRAADVYLEGSDQHRGWFQSSLLTSVALHGAAPFKTVVTHGFVVDEHGKKFGKSSKNYTELSVLLQRYSPDVLRLWALSQDYTQDLRMSAQSLKQSSERYRKLRNTLRFCLQNLSDYDFKPGTEPLGSLHQHQLGQMGLVQARMRQSAEQMDFAGAVTALVLFCETTSNEYFSALKDALYCDAAGAPARRQAQGVLAELLAFLVRALVPVMPYTAEEVFQVVRERAGWPESCSLLSAWGAQREAALPAQGWGSVATWQLVRREVNQQLEAHRTEQVVQQGLAGVTRASSLVATVHGPWPLPRDPDVALELANFVGCAAVELNQGGTPAVAVTLRKTDLDVCPRCRQARMLFTALCARCAEVEKTSKAKQPF